MGHKFRYQSIFANASYQFCGHVDEYLIANTRYLALFYTETRFGKKNHALKEYEEGKLVSERQFASSHNIFLFYFLIFIRHTIELWRFASRQKGRTLVLCGHPVHLFAMGPQRLFHRLDYSYWIGDFFPSRRFVIRAFETVKRFYHRHVRFRWYLSDAINRVMNGEVLNTPTCRTVAWGFRLRPGCEIDRGSSRRMLFVGLLRSGQGIDRILDFLTEAPEYSLSIIGEAANGFDVDVLRMIEQRGLKDRVFFPNRFYSQEELDEEAKRAFAGIALYDTSPDNFTHYADPGKVKAYIEMGLPVIMTRISDVTAQIERFRAGEIVESPEDVGRAAKQIVEEGPTYRHGVLAFAAHFDFERYYGESFKAFEEET